MGYWGGGRTREEAEAVEMVCLTGYEGCLGRGCLQCSPRNGRSPHPDEKGGEGYVTRLRPVLRGGVPGVVLGLEGSGTERVPVRTWDWSEGKGRTTGWAS